MTAPEPRVVGLDPSQRQTCHEGDCTSTFTVQLSPYRGRLCPQHAEVPTIPAGGYRSDLAMDLVDLGRADSAFAYLAAYLARECDDRFAAAVASLTRTDTTGDER